MPSVIQYPVQDAAPFIGFDVELVTSIIGRMEIEEYASDVFNTVYKFAELADLVLVVVIDRVIDIEGRMCRVPNVPHDSIEGLPTKGIMSRPKSIDTDKHGIG